MPEQEPNFREKMDRIVYAAEAVKEFVVAAAYISTDQMDEPISRDQMGRLYDLVRAQRDALDAYARTRGW